MVADIAARLEAMDGRLERVENTSQTFAQALRDRRKRFDAIMTSLKSGSKSKTWSPPLHPADRQSVTLRHNSLCNQGT